MVRIRGSLGVERSAPELRRLADNGAPLGIQLGDLFAGSTDLIGAFRANRATLDALGRQTVEVESFLGHTGGLLPPIACPDSTLSQVPIVSRICP